MHNVNILYLIIDVPTLRQVMQITRVTRLYTASRREDGRRRRRRTPMTSSAEAVSLCGLIALFGDDGCIFMPGSSAPWARREILKREGTKYSSSRRRYYYTLLAVKKKKNAVSGRHVAMFQCEASVAPFHRERGLYALPVENPGIQDYVSVQIV